MNTRLINVEVLPQQMGDGFDELMDEAYRQQRVALAAPDLLDALVKLLKITEFARPASEIDAAIAASKAAIAKAKGAA